MEPSQRPRAVFAVTDMFFMSKIEAALPAAPELEVVWVSQGESIAEVCLRVRPAMVLADLQDQALNPLPELARLKSELGSGIRIVGFLPHVRMDLREGAVQAGVDKILTRSAITKLLPDILMEAAGITRANR